MATVRGSRARRGEEALRAAISGIEPLDAEAMAAARERQERLTKPQGSLGRLEEVTVWLAGVRRQAVPRLGRKVVITAAADHGVALRGVSAYPQEVTFQMVGNFLAGGAAINVLARLVGARVVVVDAGVARQHAPSTALVARRAGAGTADITVGPAMSRQQALSCLGSGIELAERLARRGPVTLATGDMGIGNTTAAAAVVACLTGAPAASVTGRGTGIDDETRGRKVRLIEEALARNAPDAADPIDVLHKAGGFELGFLAGVILGGAAQRAAVVLDGVVSGVAALLACRLAPAAREYLLAAHRSPEPAHGVALQELALEPLLDLGMRLGEGTGAVLGLMLLEAACRLHAEMATFESAGVSGRLRARSPA